MSAFNAVKGQFQSVLLKSGVREDTVADLEVNGIITATQFLMHGNMNQHVTAHDFTNLRNEI